MQEEHTKEVHRLTLQIEAMNEEKKGFMSVIQRLSGKIEKANQVGHQATLDDIPELRKGILA